MSFTPMVRKGKSAKQSSIHRDRTKYRRCDLPQRSIAELDDVIDEIADRNPEFMDELSAYIQTKVNNTEE